LADVPNLVGGPDTMVAGIFLRVYGKAPGSVLFLMPKESAFYLVEHLLGEQKSTEGELTEMDQSALMEIGNILAGSYLNALSYYTKLTLLPSIPAMAVDMAGAILNVVIVQLGQMGDHALVIETQFLSEDDGINGHFFLIPDSGSLQIILNAVGVK
jgi:chemotaxis protein CheC